jgi:hypothetical protein
MNKTFADMKSNVGLELQDTSNSFNTLIGKFLNRRYFQCLRYVNWDAINPAYTVTTVIGTQDYALPRDFGKAVYAIDTTNNITYEEVMFDDEAGDPSHIAQQGAANKYTIYESPVAVQPTAASAVTVVSSSASDSSAGITIRGTVGGVERYETLTFNGTTPVVGTLSFTRIISVSKDTTVGYVTVTCNSQTVAVIEPERKVVRYKILRFLPIPSAVTTVTIPYHIVPLPLSQDDDVPLIDIDDCLEAGARADGWRYKRQGQKASVEEANYQSLMSDYVYSMENKPNMVQQFKVQPYDRS